MNIDSGTLTVHTLDALGLVIHFESAVFVVLFVDLGGALSLCLYFHSVFLVLGLGDLDLDLRASEVALLPIC